MYVVLYNTDWVVNVSRIICNSGLVHDRSKVIAIRKISSQYRRNKCAIFRVLTALITDSAIPGEGAGIM
jgi:hypothetical protein